MVDHTLTFDADLDYAVRMVLKGYGTPTQAAQVCGVSLSDIEERLAREQQAPTQPQ